MQARGYFESFFGDTATAETKVQMRDHERVIARWLSCFVRQHFPELLLELIQIHGQHLTRPFTELLGQAVWADEKELLDPKTSIWVSVLLSQGEEPFHQEMRASLLQKCRIPEDLGVAVRLFELLTQPRVHLRKHFDFPDIVAGDDAMKTRKNKPRKVEFEIVWPVESQYWLRKAWQKLFQPQLTLVAESLALVVTKQLTLAHLLLRGVDQADDSFDILSWQRSSIAPHDQNRDSLHECLAVLVDAARDILVHWLSACPPRARAQMEVWWSSRVPLLRRLTVYGIGLDPQVSADKRVEWLLKNDLIFRSGMKKEVFDVLAIGYPRSSESARRKLLRRIAQGHRASFERYLIQRLLHTSSLMCSYGYAGLTNHVRW
jgi:hypothetical protein